MASRERTRRGFFADAKKIRQRSNTRRPLPRLSDATSWKRRGPLIVGVLESRVPDVRTGLGVGEFQSNKIARNYARARA